MDQIGERGGEKPRASSPSQVRLAKLTNQPLNRLLVAVPNSWLVRVGSGIWPWPRFILGSSLHPQKTSGWNDRGMQEVRIPLHMAEAILLYYQEPLGVVSGLHLLSKKGRVGGGV